MDPLIIIGTGLAGYNLAKEFRKADKERPLVMLTFDDGRNYSKPMLSTGFTKNKTADELAMADVDAMRNQLNAEIKTGVEVTGIQPGDKTLTLKDGETLKYSDLVIAWGADVFRPPLTGDGLDHVYSVNDLMDYGRFRGALDGKKRVLIIGAGLIGCEFANDLSNGGFDIEVVDPVGRCLPQLLPEQASRAVERGLTELGVTFHWGSFVQAVHKMGDELEVTLSDHSKLTADIVVSAIGLRPRVKLAEEAGLKVNRAIITNKRLQTSDPNIYALGDCSEVDGNVLLYVLPLMASARALAKTLAGTPTEVKYPPMPVTVKTPCCPIVVSPAPEGVEGEWKCEVEGNSVKAMFYDDTGELRGFALTGDKISEKAKLAKELPHIIE